MLDGCLCYGLVYYVDGEIVDQVVLFGQWNEVVWWDYVVFGMDLVGQCFYVFEDVGLYVYFGLEIWQYLVVIDGGVEIVFVYGRLGIIVSVGIVVMWMEGL